MSRIWGGIHFMSDNLAGLQTGTEVGNYVIQHALLAPTRSGKVKNRRRHLLASSE